MKVICTRNTLPEHFIPIILVAWDRYSSVENKVKCLPPVVVSFKKSCSKYFVSAGFKL